MWLDSDIYTQVEEATGTYYTKDFIDNKSDKILIPEENIESLIEDLLSEIEHLKEEAKDRERDIEDNYISRPMSDYTGNPEDDRY